MVNNLLSLDKFLSISMAFDPDLTPLFSLLTSLPAWAPYLVTWDLGIEYETLLHVGL
jgi:hypothetical protein